MVRDLLERLPLLERGTLALEYGKAWEGKIYLCRRWRVVRVVLTWLYWLYLVLTSLSILEISYEQPCQHASNRVATLWALVAF